MYQKSILLSQKPSYLSSHAHFRYPVVKRHASSQSHWFPIVYKIIPDFFLDIFITSTITVEPITFLIKPCSINIHVATNLRYM